MMASSVRRGRRGAARAAGAAALAPAVVAALVLAGCDGGEPGPRPTATRTPLVYPSPSGPRVIAGNPLPDCQAVLGLIPRDVSTEIGTDTPPEPSPSPGADRYTVHCNLIGHWAADRQIKLHMIVRMERPLRDPYDFTPLAEWLRKKPKSLAGEGCQGSADETPWPEVDSGYRCVEEHPTSIDATVAVAGTANGAAIGVYISARPFEKTSSVSREAARAAAATAAERTIKSITKAL
jgi:hypothetical protein